MTDPERQPAPDDTLHRAIRRGDLVRVMELVAPRGGERVVDVNGKDWRELTPLMVAAQAPGSNVEIVRFLLQHGAEFEPGIRDGVVDLDRSVVRLAVGSGDPLRVAALVEAGADIQYRTRHGYDAVIDAVHSRDVLRDPRLIGLLEWLLARGVPPDGISGWGESGLRTLARLGRWDGVDFLLRAGADPAALEWSPLMFAVALGSVRDVEVELAKKPALEARDYWERTAWLLAIAKGEVEKARLLSAHGADISAGAIGGASALFHALRDDLAPMLAWLLELGFDVEATDDYGSTPLREAVTEDSARSVELLLRAGADVNQSHYDRGVIHEGISADVVRLLLDAGADPADLSSQGQRVLLGFAAEPEEDRLEATREQFLASRTRRFGVKNPEEVQDVFWEQMVRAGVQAVYASLWFEGSGLPDSALGAVWCAQRYGQSITFLPDGRVIQIGGEHEDWYATDFCIYNDVFVHEPGGRIRIFGYPEADFAPTDFHTATLVGDAIYVIGCLGYEEARRFHETPVYRLDTTTLRMEYVPTHGDNPGWISAHRAHRVSASRIRISGGSLRGPEGTQCNGRTFVLDLERGLWTVES